MTRKLIAALVVAYWIGPCPSIIGAGTLDQSYFVSYLTVDSLGDAAIAYNQTIAQTFTVGLAGTLDSIALQIRKETGTVSDAAFELFRTSNAMPPANGALPVFSSILPLTQVPTINTFPDPELPYTSIDVSSANISVMPGDEFAIVLSSINPPSPPWLVWRGTSTLGQVYAGGNSFSRSGSGPWVDFDPADYGFRTFVREVPEPSGVCYLLAALGVVNSFRKRR